MANRPGPARRRLPFRRVLLYLDHYRGQILLDNPLSPEKQGVQVGICGVSPCPHRAPPAGPRFPFRQRQRVHQPRPPVVVPAAGHQTGKKPQQPQNDNCFVERKNYASVRKIVGYGRFSDEKGVAALQAVYSAYDSLLNYFYPCQKLAAKERVVSKVKKTRQASTPV